MYDADNQYHNDQVLWTIKNFPDSCTQENMDTNVSNQMLGKADDENKWVSKCTRTCRESVNNSAHSRRWVRRKSPNLHSKSCARKSQMIKRVVCPKIKCNPTNVFALMMFQTKMKSFFPPSLSLYMKSSFPKRYKFILIVFMKMTFFYLDPYILLIFNLSC